MTAAQTDLVDGRRRAIDYHATQLAADMASEAQRLHEAAERMVEQLQRDAAKLNGLEDILAHMVKLMEIGD